jgi:hypothetical protein
MVITSRPFVDLYPELELGNFLKMEAEPIELYQIIRFRSISFNRNSKTSFDKYLKARMQAM